MDYNGEVKIRFYRDPESGEPHVLRHGVSCAEAAFVVLHAVEDGRGERGTRLAVGQTGDGRWIMVVYSPDSDPDSVFVITAYPLRPKALKALRRRRKGKR